MNTPVSKSIKAKKHSARLPMPSNVDDQGVEVIDFDTYLRRKEQESGVLAKAANMERMQM